MNSKKICMSVVLMLFLFGGISAGHQIAHAYAPTYAVICDNLDTGCFSVHQTAGGWGYIDPNNGDNSTTYNEHAYWTFNNQNSSLDWGKWTPNLSQEGKYDVYIWYPHFPGYYPETNSAHYQVHHRDGDSHFTWNQASNYGAWRKLTTVCCPAGTTCYVKLTDETHEGTATRRVWFDAVKFTRIDTCETYSISGKVVDSGGGPVSGVTISDGAGHNTTTNSSGAYTLSNVETGSYTISASKSGYTFSPSSHDVTVPPNATGKNFTVTNRYAIKGRVTDKSGNGIKDVPILCKGLTWNGTVKTDSNGYYVCSDLVRGLYAVTSPENSPYTLSPRARGWFVVPPNRNDQDFTTTPVYGSLGGRVTARDTGRAIAKARVSAGGKVGYTNSSGNYVLNNILPGTHKVYVSASGYQNYRGSATVRANASTAYNVRLKPVRAEGYRLPYPGGATYKCTQGNGGPFSHTGTQYYAFDFGMPVGRNVVAVRDGVVAYVKENSSLGGCNPAYLNYANYVLVKHADSTYSIYVHLQAWSVPVAAGQSVKSGQVIGRSGQTGYSCGAHLHFYRRPTNSYWSTRTSFLDVASNGGVPVTGGWYKSDNYRTRLLQGAASPTSAQADTEPPTGQVRFQMTGEEGVYNLRLDAFDYDSNALQMRLAPMEDDLSTASWETLTNTVPWTAPMAWVQFKDDSENISEVYSDTVEAINYEPVQAAFTISPTVCVGENIQIVNQTTPFCEQCGWTWDLGNGKHSNTAYPGLEYPYMGYTQTGTYSVTLHVANIDSVSSVSHQVEAVAAPAAAFTITRSGESVTVEAMEHEATRWLWDFGDGITGTGRTATHIYTDTTTLYPIQLRILSSNGCSGVGYQYVPPLQHVYLPLVLR